MPKKIFKNYLGRDFKKQRHADKLSKESRSHLMSRIRSRDTSFEKNFIKLLKRNTRRRFSINDRSIRGTPDIVFKKDKLCIFLDSDFWHGWQYSRWKHLLKNNFWRDKIQNNRNRDKKVTNYLRNKDWKVFRIWEHNVNKDSIIIIKEITKLLS